MSRLIPTLNYTKGELRELIRESPGYAAACLSRLYSFQTTEEQCVNGTIEQNGAGFNSCDGNILSDFARFYKERGYLTDRQLDLVRRTIPKYLGQLEDLPISPLPFRSTHEVCGTVEKTVVIPPNEKIATIVGEFYQIRFPYDATTVDLVKTLSGRKWNAEGYYWTAPVTTDNDLSLRDWGFERNGETQALDKLIPEISERLAVLEGKPVPRKTPLLKSIPGLKKELYPYQLDGVQYIEDKNGRALIADDMGLGKTAQALAWAQLHPEHRPLIIVVPASLKLNWEREIRSWTTFGNNTQIVEGRYSPSNKLRAQKDVVIINYDILTNTYIYADGNFSWIKLRKEVAVTKSRYVYEPYTGWVDHLIDIKPQLLITDECFVAGTMIKTPTGDTPIEQIKPGDIVFNAVGVGTVRCVGVKEAVTLTLHLSNKKKITCTPTHPFFTNDGWITAENLYHKNLLQIDTIFNIMAKDSILKIGDFYAKNKHALRMVWNHLYTSFLVDKKILQHVLLGEMENDTSTYTSWAQLTRKMQSNFRRFQTCPQKQPGMGGSDIKKNDRTQPLFTARNYGQGKRSLENIWASFESNATKRWQWKSVTQSTQNTMDCVRSQKVGSGIPNIYKPVERVRVPLVLQSRPSFTRHQSMGRGGWVQPRDRREQINRQEKGRSFNNIRVERVEILEPRNTYRSCGGPPKNRTVYNLEVSGHPTYFVEGVLVHNCQYWKNNDAGRTVAVKALAKATPYFIPLSGTPLENRPEELFNVINAVNDKIFPYYFHYCKRYCGAVHTGFGWDFSGASNIPELHAKLTASIMIRRKKCDVLKDLPSKVRSVVPVEINNRREYASAEANFIEWVHSEYGEEKANTARNAEALVRIEGLKQLATKGKLDVCVTWIRDFLASGEKLVVFCTHQNVVDRLMKEFAECAVRIDGTVPPGPKRQAAVDAFQSDPKITLLAGNLIAAGVGLTLTAASNTCTIELAAKPGLHFQAEDRVHRIGQTAESVNAWYLVAVDTIENDIMTLLDAKHKVLAQVLDGEEVESTSLLTDLLKNYRRGELS